MNVVVTCHCHSDIRIDRLFLYQGGESRRGERCSMPVSKVDGEDEDKLTIIALGLGYKLKSVICTFLKVATVFLYHLENLWWLCVGCFVVFLVSLVN